MAADYPQDAREMILAQLRAEQRASEGSLGRMSHSYFQVEYMQRQIVKVNAEEADHYQKSVEEENVREYFDQIGKDKNRYEHIKHDLKTKYFRISAARPPSPSLQPPPEPIDLIKSFSQTQALNHKSSCAQSLRESHLAKSMISHQSDPKSKFAEDIQQFLTSSLKLTQKRNKYRLRGGTTSEKEKMNEQVMRHERQEILDIIKRRDYSLNRPTQLNEIPNKEKYSLDYLEYLRTKTKMGLDKDLYQKKIRKINGRLENFQEFILREVKLKEDTRGKLQNFYVKMRDQFTRIESNQSPKRK